MEQINTQWAEKNGTNFVRSYLAELLSFFYYT
jgi:hypothetical protein